MASSSSSSSLFVGLLSSGFSLLLLGIVFSSNEQSEIVLDLIYSHMVASMFFICIVKIANTQESTAALDLLASNRMLLQD